jgi:hypothetical protein
MIMLVSISRKMTFSVTLALLVAIFSLAFTAPVFAGKPDTDCLRAGQATLRSLDAFQAAARGEVDYSAFADAEAGPIFLGLEEGSFLKLSEVFKLHKSNPELFAWCARE